MPDEPAKPPLLKVTLGEPAEAVRARTAPELEPMTSEFGQIINRPHYLQIVAGSLELPSFETRFSNINFSDGKVAVVDTNPQEGYLGLAKAADVILLWTQRFTTAGFHDDAAKKLAPPSGDKEVVYRGSKDNFESLIVLEKAVPKNSDTGRLANVKEDLYLIHLTVTMNLP